MEVEWVDDSGTTDTEESCRSVSWVEKRDMMEEEKFEGLTGTAASVVVKEGVKVVAGEAREMKLDVDGTTAIEVVCTDVDGLADDVALVEVLRVVAGTGTTTGVLTATVLDDELALAVFVGLVFVSEPALNTLREFTCQNESAKAAGLFAT